MNARARSVAIIATIVVLDRLTKLYIQSHFSFFDTVPVISGVFNIVHGENPGAAFGFLTDSHAEWRRPVLVGVSLVEMAVIGALLFRKAVKKSPWMEIALAFVFGGAAGNLWDRAFRGTVTDFLQVFIGSYEFPSFNVADSAISIGAVLLLVDVWRNRREQ